MKTPLFAMLIGFTITAIAGAPARADWTLCNETSFVAEAAIAYDEGARRVTEGWTRIRPGECEVVKNGPLTIGTHFLYSRSSHAHRGGLREWSGYENLCVDSADFSIAGEAVCEDVGFETRSFVEILIEEEEWTSSLMEPNAYDQERAAAAGLQRLLTDAGYDVRVIDGYAGRRTELAVQRFLADQSLGERPEPAVLIDHLEEVAQERADEAGLKLCNHTSGEVWAAIATRLDDSWESRGWWPLGPEECARVLDAELDAPAYYVYAGLREDGEDRPLNTADENFCLSETRFAIIGRENCNERGYAEGRFATVLAQGRAAVTLDFNMSDFDASPSGGLRR